MSCGECHVVGTSTCGRCGVDLRSHGRPFEKPRALLGWLPEGMQRTMNLPARRRRLYRRIADQRQLDEQQRERLASYRRQPWHEAGAVVNQALGNTPRGCLVSLGWTVLGLLLVAGGASWVLIHAFGVGAGDLGGGPSAILDEMVLKNLTSPPAHAYLAFGPALGFALWRLVRAARSPWLDDVINSLRCPHCGGSTQPGYENDQEGYLLVCKTCQVVWLTGIEQPNTGDGHHHDTSHLHH